MTARPDKIKVDISGSRLRDSHGLLGWMKIRIGQFLNNEICSNCGGTGTVFYDKDPYGYSVTNLDTCDVCGGDGLE